MKKESTACRGWLSTGQEFALQEYAERYGIRYLTVHLSYLKELVDYANVSLFSFDVGKTCNEKIKVPENCYIFLLDGEGYIKGKINAIAQSYS